MTPAALATQSTRETRIGYICAFSVLSVWTGFLLSGRLAATQPFTPWDVAALRYLGGFVGALALLAFLPRPRLAPPRLAGLLATAAFGFPLAAYHGFGFAPVAHAGVLNAGALPFVSAALGAIFLGEGWTRRRLLSLAVVAAGVGLLAVDTFGAHPGAWRGHLLFLGGVTCWAVYMLLVRIWRITAIEATLGVALWAAPLYLPIWWLALPTNLAAVPWGAILFQAVFQGIFAVLVAGFLFTRAVQAIGAPRTTAITALVPALAALAAWPLLGEALGAAGLSGVVLVSVGMLLGVLRVDPTPARP